ncbi:hypothetical protein DFH29DRAFT_881369 [Suillus ampliporus]|nr:hypothetical protein DFH29DRAFT_881369 [Suillus ampliporus]
MARTKVKTGDQPRLNDQETTALQSHVEDWEKASGTEQRRIFKAASREAKLLAPKMDKELLKERKEKYRQWFHNHKKHKADAKPLMKLQKKWTARRVIEEERKADIVQQIREEIEQETGEKPGQKEVLKRYQPTMTAIMKGLDDNELEEAQAKAEEWTNHAPDAAVQAKTAKKKGEKMIKHFAKEMFTQAGMRLFVLGSWKDEQGSLLTSGFDFNEQLGKGSSFMKSKDWQVILPAWEEFIGDVFDQDQDGTLLGGTRRGPKPYYEFDLDHMGLPILPDIDGFSLDTKKGIIRSFLTIHYSKPYNRVPAPSSDTCHHRDMLWKAEGPSALERHHEGTVQIHLQHISARWYSNHGAIQNTPGCSRHLLECWLDRQENQVGLTFKFKAWIDDKCKMHPPVGEESDEWPTKRSSATAALSPAGLAKDRPRLIRRAYISSADEESSETDADVSPPKKVVNHAPKHVGNSANADRSDLVGHQSESDDRPLPKSLGKTVRVEPATILPHIDLANEDRPMIDSVRKALKQGPEISLLKLIMLASMLRDSAHIPLIVVSNIFVHPQWYWTGHQRRLGLTRDASLVVQDRAPKKTRATRDASPVVQDRSPKKTTRATRDASLAVHDRSPKKTRVTRLVADQLSNAPAKRTRSKVDNSLGARPWQKPKRYADYV